ncbi:MAG: ABC transporter permease, partial [Gemmatimonadales bacterium]
RWLKDIRFRIRVLLFPGRMERDIEDEMAFHRQMEAEKLMGQGMTRDEAESEARRRFGSEARQKERVRESWGIGLVTDLLSDAAYALRQFRRNPTFAMVSVLTLALGIGATVAMFGVVEGLILRPLPFPDEDEVVNFWFEYSWRGVEFDYAKEVVEAFDGIAAYTSDAEPFQTEAGTRLLPVTPASAELFDVLQVRPVMGRAFEAGEDRPGAEPVMVISYGLWQQELGGADDVIGKAVNLGGRSYTVIGVMPPGFYFPTPEDRAWLPLLLDPASKNYQGNGYLSVVGRRADGVSVGALDADVLRLGAALGERFTYSPRWDKSANPHLVTMREYVLGDVEPVLILLFGAVVLVLVMACANAAALILARTTDRTGELSLRVALGAGRGRLIRQVLTESAVLAFLAAAAGVSLARGLFGALLSSLPLSNGYAGVVEFPWLGLIASFALAFLVAIAVAIVPIVALLRGRLGGLRSARSEAGAQRHTGRAHGVLVGAEVLLALTLLTGAALFIRSVANLQRLDLGLDPKGVVTVDLVAPTDMAEPERRAFFDELLRRVRAQPGVRAAALISRLPIRDGGWQGPTSIASRPELSGPARPNSYWRSATPDYFRTMGIELIEGRSFDEADRDDAVDVAIVSESFARTMWPDGSAIGQRISGTFDGQGQWREVVGVVEETRMHRILGDNDLAMYVPYAQSAPGVGQVLVIETPVAIIESVRGIVRELDPSVAVARPGPMEDVVSTAMVGPLRLRFFLTLFAGLGLLLGVVGVYGVVSYAVTRRRAEYGIRMALGATPTGVLRHVVRRGMIPVATGVVAGIALSLSLAKVAAGLLYEVAPTDLASLAVAAGVLLATGVLASLVPAWRAGRTRPMEVLRVD